MEHSNTNVSEAMTVPQTPDGDPSPYSAWEYIVKHVSGGPMPERELNKYGVDGWELCGIASTPEPSRSMSNAWPDVMAYTFKRRIVMTP